MKHPRNRKQAREFAIQSLFAQEFQPEEPNCTFPEGEAQLSMDKEYAQEILKGIATHHQEIDALLQDASPKWKVERMDRVDKSILRTAVWEMQFAPEKLDPSIAINEAIELAKQYGTDDSYKLINGILDTVSKKK